MPGLDETENEFRYRLKEPSMFMEGMFKSKALAKPGLRLIIGKLKDNESGSMVAQSVRFDKKNWDRPKALAWIKNHKDQFSIDPATLFSVKNVEIFETGCWNGKEITESDLDNIVDAFTKTKDMVRPFLKLGHSDNQKILQEDGLPAAGWVENVRKNGSKLIADFVDVPKKIFQLMKNKAYRKVSCEIYSNVSLKENKFPKMLGAVSLLGSDLPAVLSLNDILSLYTSNHDFSSVECFTNGKTCDTIISNEIKNKSDKDNPVMPELEKLKFKLEQEQNRIKDLEKKIKEKDGSIDKFKSDLDKANAEKAEAETKILEAQKKEKEALVDKFISEISSEKLCSKAMQPMVKELLSDKTEKFSVGDKEVDKFELVKEILKFSKEASKVNFEEKTSNDGDKVDDVEKVEKYAKEKGIEFSEAYRQLNIK